MSYTGQHADSRDLAREDITLYKGYDWRLIAKFRIPVQEGYVASGHTAGMQLAGGAQAICTNLREETVLREGDWMLELDAEVRFTHQVTDALVAGNSYDYTLKIHMPNQDNYVMKYGSAYVRRVLVF